MPIEVDWIQIVRWILTSMSNIALKRDMDLVKVELDSDSESQPETSSTEAQQTDLKQEKFPAPFTFVAVTEVVSADDVTFCFRICNRIACGLL
jgi:hypothetical protein